MVLSIFLSFGDSLSSLFVLFCYRFVFLFLLCRDGSSFFFVAWHVVIVLGVVYFFLVFRAVLQFFLFYFRFILLILLCCDGSLFFS